MKKSSIFLIIGGIFISIIGFLGHDAFKITEFLPLALFTPVNESVWEHLKLTFWPAMLFLIIEHFYVKKKEDTKNFGIGKTIGILMMPLTIVLIFYTYTAFTGTSILLIDILSFFIAVIVGQIVSFMIFKSKKISKKINSFIPLLLILTGIIFIIFTFFPPALPIFYDSLLGGYGIP